MSFVRKARSKELCPNARGFTLVELLVVIGIIAMLISILLPSLNGARRAAKQIKCASHMRQVALAMMLYTNDSKGALMPCMVWPGGAGHIYPDGWWWAAELVHRKYIVAPDIPVDPNNPNQGLGIPDLGVFQCPEAIPATEYNLKGGNKVGLYPTDGDNRSWCYVLRNGPRFDKSPPYGTGTTYQLNARLADNNGSNVTTGYTSNYTTTGMFNPPFVYFDSGSNSVANQDNLMKLPGLSRKLANIRHSSNLVMLVEASGYAWDQNQTGNADKDGVLHYCRGLGARHGRVSADKKQAYTNLAYFDGHVECVPTGPIDLDDRGTSGAKPMLLDGQTITGGLGGASSQELSRGTVFTLFMANRG